MEIISKSVVMREDGVREEHFVMEDGSTPVMYRNMTNGHLLPGSQVPNRIDNRETAITRIRAKVNEYQQAAAEAIQAEADAIGFKNVDPVKSRAGTAAWGALVGKTWVAIMNSEKPRGDDMLAVGKAVGAIIPDSLMTKEDQQNVANSWIDFLRQSNVKIEHKAEEPPIDAEFRTDDLHQTDTSPQLLEASVKPVETGGSS